MVGLRAVHAHGLHDAVAGGFYVMRAKSSVEQHIQRRCCGLLLASSVCDAECCVVDGVIVVLARLVLCIALVVRLVQPV